MGVIRRLANPQKNLGDPVRTIGSQSSTVRSLFGSGGDEVNVLEEYRGFVWKCINVRSEAVARTPIYVERKVGEKWQKDDTHEFQEVLDGKEGQHSLHELLEAHQVSLDMFGESFWYFAKGERFDQPMARYLLDPGYVTVYVSGGEVKGYLYNKGGTNITFDLDEIAHYRIYDPNNPYRGLGPMQAAGWFIRSARYVNTYVNNFLENNAVPAGVIVASADANEKDWELFKKTWAEKHSGIDNAGKTGFVRGSDLKFEKTGLSLGDVDFSAMKNTSRDDIMAMFSVSKPLLGIYDDINRASAVTARQLFASTFTEPAMERISSTLTPKLREWYGDQFRIGFDNPTPEDREFKLNEFRHGVNRWFTTNEAREAYGLDPIEGGDELDANNVAPQQERSAKKVVMKRRDMSYEKKESYRSKVEEIQKKHEQRVIDAAQPILEEQKENVLNQVKPKALSDANFDVEKEREKLAEEILPIFISLAREQGDEANAVIGASGFKVGGEMERYLRSSVNRAAEGFTQDTADNVANAIKEGLEEGESINQITHRIDDVYSEVLGEQEYWRLERLARTEVIKTSNEVSQNVWAESNVVTKKEWFANPGACPFCQNLDGSVIAKEAVFVPKGTEMVGTDGSTRVVDYEDVSHPPSHPQCRCTTLPVVND